MTFKYFCHVCNVRFHRAIDFIRHRHEEVKTMVKDFVPDKDNEFWKDGK